MLRYITEGSKVLDMQSNITQTGEDLSINVLPNLDTYLFSYLKLDANSIKLFVFFTYTGEIKVFNVQGETASNSAITIENDSLARLQTLYPSINLDLLESTNFPTVAEDHYVIYPSVNNNVLYYNIFNAEASQFDSSGNQLINCDTGENLGNLEFAYNDPDGQSVLLRHNDIKQIFNIETQGIFDNTILPATNTVANITEFARLSQDFDSAPVITSPIFKYFVVPIKNQYTPSSNDDISYGVIAFDKTENCFFFRFLSNTLVANDTASVNLNYLFTNNGNINGSNIDYNLVLRYADINVDSDIIVSSFRGFTFDGDNNLMATASKQWSEANALFSIGEADASVTFTAMYEQLPVTFGNRLLAVSDTNITNQAGIGDDGVHGTVFKEIPTAYDNASDTASANTGYFNVAYAVKHGFILMRLHSYCPILLNPSSPDGIELHIPGGKWTYEQFTSSGIVFPSKDAGGLTPISMAFSPDNNFLYTIVADPNDRTIKYICIYNLTVLDSQAITDSAFMYPDPFDSGAKRVDLIGNKIIFFSEDGEEYIDIVSPDLFSSVAAFNPQVEISAFSQCDFDITPVKSIRPVSTAYNTWLGTDVAPVDSNVITIIDTETTDNLVLTPFGFIDLLNPKQAISGITSDGEEWLNSATLTSSNGTAVLSAKLEYVNDHPEVTVFDPATNTVFTDTDENDVIITLDDSKTFDGFYKDSDSLKIVKTQETNTYAVIVKYMYETGAVDPNHVSHAFTSFYSLSTEREYFASANFGAVAVFELTRDGINFTFNAGVDNVVRPLTDTNIGMKTEIGNFTSTFLRTKNSTKMLSLDGTNSYLLTVQNTKLPKSGTKTLQGDLGIFPFTSNVSAYGDINTGTLPASYIAFTKYSFLLPSGFSASTIDGTDVVLPEYSSIAVSHDANFVAFCLYAYEVGCFDLLLTTIDASLPAVLLGGLDTNSLYLPARMDESARTHMRNVIGQDYYVDQMEFSGNKQNLYILLLDKNQDEILETNGNLYTALPPKVLKVDLGPIQNYFNGYDSSIYGAAVHSITSANIEEVTHYSYGSNSDFSLLPTGFNSDLMLNIEAQATARIGGMFKGLDNQIYFTNRSVVDGSLLSSLGAILNSNHKMGSGPNQTKLIKAGINL